MYKNICDRNMWMRRDNVWRITAHRRAELPLARLLLAVILHLSLWYVFIRLHLTAHLSYRSIQGFQRFTRQAAILSLSVTVCSSISVQLSGRFYANQWNVTANKLGVRCVSTGWFEAKTAAPEGKKNRKNLESFHAFYWKRDERIALGAAVVHQLMTKPPRWRPRVTAGLKLLGGHTLTHTISKHLKPLLICRAMN